MGKLPPPAVWIEHFIDRLLQLAPTLNRDDATDMVVSGFLKAWSLLPEDAVVPYAKDALNYSAAMPI